MGGFWCFGVDGGRGGGTEIVGLFHHVVLDCVG